jgi:phage gp29-like protein
MGLAGAGPGRRAEDGPVKGQLGAAGPEVRGAEVPEWRKRAPAGVSLAAAMAAGGLGQGPVEGRGQGGNSLPPEGLSRSLAKLLRPQAAYRWLLPQLAAITPQYIEMVLRGAMAGSHVQAWELFDLMEDTSPRLVKNLNELKRAVAAMDWVLAPWQEEDQPPTDSAKEKVRLVSSACRRMRPAPAADENGFSGTIYDVLDAWGKGQAVLEADWEVRPSGELGDIVAPRATYWVHPTCYTWTMDGCLGLRAELAQGRTGNRTNRTAGDYKLSPGVWQSTSSQPLPDAVEGFPAHKFLISICKAKSGTALGGALLRPLAWWWCAANFSADWLLNLGQVFGLPFRWVNYDPAAPQATVDAICSMLERMGSNAWAAFPAGTTLELKEAAQTGDHSPQGDMLDRAEKQMDLLILGQTLTTDASKHGGSRALGEVHANVRAEVVQAAANFAAEVLNAQLVRSILMLNYGQDSEAPEFRPAPRKEQDTLANAQRDSTLLAAGVSMPMAWFYRRHGIPLPQPGEETVGGERESTVHSPESTIQNPPSNAAQDEDGNEKAAEQLESRRCATHSIPNLK